MTKHTPGPWMVESDGKEDATVTAFTAVHHNPVYICRVYGEGVLARAGDSTEERAANAALIAAAPDLLAALEMAVATIERIAPKHGPFSSVDGTLSVARAAIAKAEGRG